MHAGNDRSEFAPPPEPALLRAFVLAVLAHLLLVLALTHGLQWKREAQDAAVEAELWSALPQQAAPKPEPVPVQPPPPPPPPPQTVVKAPPEPPVKSQPDIALERQKHQRELERERRQADLEREREREHAKKAKAEAQKAKAEAQRKHDEELARKKELQQKQLAEAKRKEDERRARQEQQAAADEKKRQLLREENLKRMQGMAGTGPSSATGNAASSSGPSKSWAGRVQARVRPNIVFSDNVSGNPQAEVEVRLGPGGLIIGKPRLVHSSGVPSWDEAVVRALEKTESLPADTDGRYPSPVTITFRPKT